MSTHIQLRRDTAANWTANNPILAPGEIGYETDTRLIKVGNGVTAWNTVPYYNAYASPEPNRTLVNAMVKNPVGVQTNMQVITSGTSWAIPERLKQTGVSWKVTLVGGGGGGGGSASTAGSVGGGGGSGGVVVGTYSYVSGVDSMSYSIGAGGDGGLGTVGGSTGGSTTTTYNSVTFTAVGGGGGAYTAGSGGIGGAGGGAGGGILNLTGSSGNNGGVMSWNTNHQGRGGDTPLKYGEGGIMPQTAGGANGLEGTGFGSGASGGKCGTATTSRSGGNGRSGLLIVQY